MRLLILAGLLSLVIPSALPAVSPGEGEALSIGPAEGYVLGPRDIVAVTVYGEPQLSGDYEIDAGGSIRFPLLGNVAVAGLSTQAAADKLEKLLEKDYFVDAQLSVAVKEFRSYAVNVLGEVKQPGRKFLKGPLTVLEVITEAGGLTPEAGDIITLQRPESMGKTGVYTIRVEDLIAGTGGRNQMRLLPGDTLTVTAKSFFYIQGEVAKPGRYEIASDTTLLKAIALAGGFGKFADQKDIELHREAGGEKAIMKINYRDIKNQKAEDIVLLPSDTIIINKRIF
jgi:polysaccharide export outer membrane protein